MVVSRFQSGIKLIDDVINEYSFTYESRPNRLPESCGIRIENKDLWMIGIDNSNVITCDMNGKTFCIGDETNANTLYGNYYDKSTIGHDGITDVAETDSNSDNDDEKSVDKTFLKQLIVDNNNNENTNNKVAMNMNDTMKFNLQFFICNFNTSQIIISIGIIMFVALMVEYNKIVQTFTEAKTDNNNSFRTVQLQSIKLIISIQLKHDDKLNKFQCW